MRLGFGEMGCGDYKMGERGREGGGGGRGEGVGYNDRWGRLQGECGDIDVHPLGDCPIFR
jgi:hypothetical protein